jgi:hypothetical protein
LLVIASPLYRKAGKERMLQAADCFGKTFARLHSRGMLLVKPSGVTTQQRSQLPTTPAYVIVWPA